VTNRLRSEGYLPGDDKIPGCFSLTSKGLALSSATRRAISRATAAKHLAELLRRIPYIGGDPLHAFTVNAVIVFGGFVSDKQKLGDVDVAVHLETKQSTEHEYRRRLDGLLARGLAGRQNSQQRGGSQLLAAPCGLSRPPPLPKTTPATRDYGLQKLGALECCVVFGDPETVEAILPKAKIKAFRALAKPKSPCVEHQ